MALQFGAALAGAQPDPKLLYEQAPGAPAKPGVVTTVRGMGSNLPSWVQYHLEVGFCKLYIYLDDPEEITALEACPGLLRDPRVVVTKCDAAHRESWRGLKVWTKFENFTEEEVQARQELNAEHALGQALHDGITWLLHIDADELFYVPEGSVQAHFDALTKDSVSVMNYINYEGVPEKDEFENFLEEVTLFKRHLDHIPDYANKVPAVVNTVNFWVKRSPTRQQYFAGYENGKSAIAVVEGAIPLSVHEWLPPSPGLFARGCHNIKGLDTSGHLTFRQDQARILHYISCGFEWWWKKYSLLGTFENAWFGGALPIPPCFHTTSRDLVGTGDKDKAREFYHSTMVLADVTEAERQIAAGVLERIPSARDVVLRARASAQLAAATLGDRDPTATSGAADPEQACANCGAADSTGDGLLRCSRCKVVYYCSAECQRAAWTAHKGSCAPSG